MNKVHLFTIELNKNEKEHIKKMCFFYLDFYVILKGEFHKYMK